MESNRLAHLQAFCAFLSRLAKALGGPQSFDDYAWNGRREVSTSSSSCADAFIGSSGSL
jgi:hypothetical protein